MMDVRTRIDWNSGTGHEYTVAAQSEFSLNLAAANKELGINKLILHILVKTSFADLDSGANLQLVDATAENLTTNQRVLSEIPAVARTELVAGVHFMIPVPPRKLQQFLGFEFEPIASGGSDDASAGAIIAWFDEQAESEVV